MTALDLVKGQLNTECVLLFVVLAIVKPTIYHGRAVLNFPRPNLLLLAKESEFILLETQLAKATNFHDPLFRTF